MRRDALGPECPHGHEETRYDGAVFEDGAYIPRYHCNYEEVLNTYTDATHDETYEEAGPRCNEVFYGDRIDITKAVDTQTGDEHYVSGRIEDNDTVWKLFKTIDGFEPPADPRDATPPQPVQSIEYEPEMARVEVTHPETGRVYRLEFR